MKNKYLRFKVGSKLIANVLLILTSTMVSGQSITVNSINYKQIIDMIGGDMERSSKAIQNAKNKEEILQWSFEDIDFNVCRVQYDKNQELVEGVKNWSFYSKQVVTMKAIKALNPDIKFFGTMRSDYDGYGDDNNMPDWIHTYSTKVTDVVKYGIFLADYCEYMSQQGVPISILSTAKEWMWHVRASEVEDIISVLKSELNNRGIDMPIIIDQGFWSITAGITYLNDVGSLGTKELYEGFCSHNYSNLDPEKWVEIIEKSVALGKPMYDDETSTGSGSPTYGVEREMYKQIGEYIKKAERYEAGLSGEIFFEIWSRGIDKETRAIYYPASGTGTRLRGYYMMKHFSNNILNHRYLTTSIEATPNIYTITFRKDDKIVLWVINEGNNTYELPISMDNSSITSTVAAHYWTNFTPVEGKEKVYVASGNTFIPAVEAESMNCYIFNVTEDAIDICSTPQTSLYQAECYDEMSGVKKEVASEGTEAISYIDNGDWIKFNSFDFSNGLTKFSARVASNSSGGTIEVRVGSTTGTLLGALSVASTGGWQNWTTETVDLLNTSGIQDLYLVFKGSVNSLFNVNWFSLEAPESLVDLNATTSNKSVTLQWSIENSSSQYQNIYRNTSFSEGSRTLIAENINSTSYIDTDVRNGETYWYWVESIDENSVSIFSNVVKVTPSIPNLALASNGCIATQSSTAYEGPAELAIDGNTDGTFGNGSVTHTAHDDPIKWWQVDLKGQFNIDTITIYNRTGSNYGERLSNFTVEVIASDESVVFSELYADYPNPSLHIETGGVMGNRVKISKTSDLGLTLAEVEVYGEASPLSVNTVQTNAQMLYPNPVTDNFTISNSKGAIVKIYHLTGALLLEKSLSADKEIIDIRKFNSGIYTVEINKNGNLRTIKIIKQ